MLCVWFVEVRWRFPLCGPTGHALSAGEDLGAAAGWAGYFAVRVVPGGWPPGMDVFLSF